jgi:2-methylisocitrate lyase-like PEP mutase family enzyme
MNNYEKSRRLRELIRAEDTLVMPYNIRTMSVKALKDAGVARVSLPAVAILSAVRAMTDIWRSIRDTEDFADILGKNPVCGMEDIAALRKRA